MFDVRRRVSKKAKERTLNEVISISIVCLSALIFPGRKFDMFHE